MTSRPHDALFKAAFETPEDAAALLRELLPATVREAIAWETLAHEPGSFVDRALADRHNDLLFSARLRTGGRSARVFFLLEHQSTRDPALPLRVLAYQVRLWERLHKAQRGVRLPPILGVLVSHARGGWTTARTFEGLVDPAALAIPGLATLVPRFSLSVLDLAAESDAGLAARSLPPFHKLVLWLLRDSRDPERLLASFDAWIPAFKETVHSRCGSDKLAVLVQYMFRALAPTYWEPLRAKLRALSASDEEIDMTIADMFIAQGRAQGRAQGLEQGLAQGRLDTLRRLLELKFHRLDAAAEARLRAATAAEIDGYLRRLLTADSLAAVLEGGRGRRTVRRARAPGRRTGPRARPPSRRRRGGRAR